VARSPCFEAFRLRAPGDVPPRIRHLPFFIAPLRHGFPVRREWAPHLLLWCMGNLCMGSILRFLRHPRPLDVSDNGLPALMNVDMLDFDRLLGRLNEKTSVPTFKDTITIKERSRDARSR
jgi:hypothetical protein